MSKKFNLNLTSNQQNTTTSTQNSNIKDQLELIKNKKLYNLVFIKADDMIPSPYNRFALYKSIKPQKYKEIKESIRNYGLLEPLLVIPVEGKNHHYEILGGQNRHLMITELILEGDSQYSSGIPCNVISMETTEIDQQIISELSNIMAGHNDPDEIRDSIGRLEKLYKEKNEENSTNISVPKQISKDIGISERQVQKYNAVNNKLIDELQKAFDEQKIGLDKAASIANQPIDVQKLLAELLHEGSNISREEIIAAKKQAEEATIALKTAQENLKKKEESDAKYIAEIQTELETTKIKLEENNKYQTSLKEQISKELEVENPNRERLQELEKSLQILNTKKEELMKNNQERNIEIEQLKSELQFLKNQSHNDIELQFNKTNQIKIRKEIELDNILDDLKKKAVVLQVNLENYETEYGNIPDNILETLDDIFIKLNTVKDIIK